SIFQLPHAAPPRPPRPVAGWAAASAAARGQTLSDGSRSGNRQNGSRVIFSILRAPKVSSALNVRLPANQTSTGQVTIADALSAILLFGIGLMAAPLGSNCTLSTTGDGICPSWRTVTVVRPPAEVTFWIEPSTLPVVQSH